MINFAITFSGLEDQLLGVVVVEEMPEMEDRKNALVISGARMRKELQEIENTILFMLSNSTGNILDDYKLISTLGNSKVKSAEISAKVAEAEGTEQIIDESRNKYKPVAFRGSILYFCSTDLGTVDPMYQYSLQWFRSLFVQAIRLAPPSDDVGIRVQSLNDFFTHYVYRNICRSLFEKHKLLFSFLLTVRILQGNNVINPAQWLFLISGKSKSLLVLLLLLLHSSRCTSLLITPLLYPLTLTRHTHPLFFLPSSSSPLLPPGKAMTNVHHPNPAPDWIDKRMWSEISALTTLPIFANLAQDVRAALCHAVLQ